jgi:ribosome-interacting GTPase 1
MANCDVAIREPGVNVEDLIDVIEGNRVYVPALYILNKASACTSVLSRRTLTPHSQIDAISIEELDLLYKIPMSVPISSTNWWNIDELINTMSARPCSCPFSSH